ncbi:Hypothetical protein NGAL_HAMBI2605_64380 [Neorhizobium galegae bv. orientalis]|nr:Hypothetical protein NGAL_HAMBI2605_64380 [Neorhizobium galegae bv. orientalis]
MKKRTVVLGGLAALLLAGGWAYAQSNGHGPGGFGPMSMHGSGGMGPGMVHKMMGGRMGSGMTHGKMGGGLAFAAPAQVDALKADLGIKPEQEAAWIKYATALKDAAGAMTAAFQAAGNDPEDANPQDQFVQMTKIRDLGHKQFEAVQTAANELLATLDDTQKAKAQDSLPGLASGRHDAWSRRRSSAWALTRTVLGAPASSETGAPKCGGPPAHR